DSKESGLFLLEFLLIPIVSTNFVLVADARDHALPVLDLVKNAGLQFCADEPQMLLAIPVHFTAILMNRPRVDCVINLPELKLNLQKITVLFAAQCPSHRLWMKDKFRKVDFPTF